MLTALVAAADQISKFFALAHLSPGASLPVLRNIFHLTLVHNTGIAFGLLREYEFLLKIVIPLSIAVLFVFSLRLCRERGARRPPPSFGPAEWGMILILGGAVGNWIDRLRYGAVVDFLDFRVWPVFNFADSAITVGICLFILDWIRRCLEDKRRKNEAVSS